MTQNMTDQVDLLINEGKAFCECHYLYVFRLTFKITLTLIKTPSSDQGSTNLNGNVWKLQRNMALFIAVTFVC